jgi:hypothetical protein
LLVIRVTPVVNGTSCDVRQLANAFAGLRALRNLDDRDFPICPNPVTRFDSDVIGQKGTFFSPSAEGMLRESSLQWTAERLDDGRPGMEPYIDEQKAK